MSKLTNKLGSWLREFWYFITSTYFLKNFGKLLGIALLLFLGLTFWMRCYTRHGDSTEVGKYVGMTYEDAIATIEDDNFRHVVLDSIFRVDAKPGLVLEQSPKPNSRVKDNRTIYLTITKRIPDEVALPSLVGNDDYNGYAKKLKFLDIRTKSKQVFNNKLEPNTILHFFFNGKKYNQKDVTKGLKVPRGATLEFVITSREGGKIKVPDVVCMSFDEAEFLITNSGLKLGKVIEDSTVSDRANAYVKSQFPMSSRVSVGTNVEVQLTQNKPPSCD